MVCEAQPVWGLARLSLGLAAAWPYPSLDTLVFFPPLVCTWMATELARWTVATRSTGDVPVLSRPWSEGRCNRDSRAHADTCSRRVCVTSGLSPVPLCPVCAQMSTNAARRMGGATRYATTSQAASTVPATAATCSPRTAGAAEVRPWIWDPRAVPGLSPHRPVALFSAPPFFYFCNCQVAAVGSHVGSSARGSWQWLLLFWKGGKEGGGVSCRKSTCPGMSAARDLPQHHLLSTTDTG